MRTYLQQKVAMYLLYMKNTYQFAMNIAHGIEVGIN